MSPAGDGATATTAPSSANLSAPGIIAQAAVPAEYGTLNGCPATPGGTVPTGAGGATEDAELAGPAITTGSERLNPGATTTAAANAPTHPAATHAAC